MVDAAEVADIPAAPPRRGFSNSGNLEEGLPVARSRIIAPSLLLPAEVIVFELKPSLWYVFIISFPVVALGAAAVLLALAIEDLPQVVRHWGTILGVWVMGLRVAVALFQWLGRTYVLTDRRILEQRGVMNVTVECLGLEEIESSFVAQSAFQRVLRIGTIFFRCAADGRRRHGTAWEHVPQPKEVHGVIVAQIERWKHVQSIGGEGA